MTSIAAIKFDNFNKSLPAKNRYTFDIHNIDLGLVNSVRRIILTNIPVVGFDGEIDPSLEVIKNDGPLHNEFMLHRFGLIPIHFSEDETDNFVSDDHHFELNVQNTSGNTINVTTHDFQVSKNGKDIGKKELQRLFPVDSITKQPILITRLRPGETLHVKGKAILSTAHHHAGFSPVSLCTLSFKQDTASAAHKQAQNVLEKERIYFQNKYGDPTIVQFEIETESALSPKYLVSKAIDIIMQKLFRIIEEIYIDDSEYIQFQREKSHTGTNTQFVFKDEDDTLGNVLQSMMHNHYIRDKKPATKDHRMTYVGYYCPHPLESRMVLRFNFEDPEAPDIDYINTLKEHCERTLAYLQNIQAEWSREAP